MEINIQKIIQISHEAGNAILDIYNHEELFKVIDYKSDNSPLTLADKKSHEIIAHKLNEIYPEIPLLSEEGKNIPYEIRQEWSQFWLVDPLDGTKEFIKRNGEFTVNIALITNNFPVAGVIYTPVTGITYYAKKGDGAFKLQDDAEIHLTGPFDRDHGRVAVRSRSHASPEEEKIFGQYGVSDYISVGSSLKFCMVAEGKADLYYRHGPTMEWDTAAGQAIVEETGCKMINIESKQSFSYNKPSLLNPGFLVSKN